MCRWQQYNQTQSLLEALHIVTFNNSNQSVMHNKVGSNFATKLQFTMPASTALVYLYITYPTPQNSWCYFIQLYKCSFDLQW
jgi:hypothetical protein